jgi:hypothetical protein
MRCQDCGATVICEDCAALAAELDKWKRPHMSQDLQDMKKQAEENGWSLVAKQAYISALEWRYSALTAENKRQLEVLGKVATARDTAMSMLEDAEGKVERFTSILKEQEEIVAGIGPITCRNGKIHDLDSDDDCFFCKLDILTADRDRQDARYDSLDKVRCELAYDNGDLRIECDRLREALDTIEGMATDTTYDIQGIAQAALAGKEEK